MGIRVQAWGSSAGVSWQRITASNLSLFWPLLGAYLFKSLRLYSCSRQVHTCAQIKERLVKAEVKVRGERKGQDKRRREV